MKIFGIRFAPLNIPLERRLQTLAAAIWVMSMISRDFTIFIIIMVLSIYTQIRYFILLYFIWMYYDWDTCNCGGRRYSRLVTLLRNNVFWRYFCNYFPIKLIKTVDLDPTKSYLFVCIPHGILPVGVTGAFTTDILDCKKLFPGLDIRIIILDLLLKIPFTRECLFWFGCCSCSPKSIKYLLSTPPENPFTGRATILVVGAALETLESKPGTYRTVVKKRKGFVKLALQHGTTLVPVFSFGETDMFNQLHCSEGSLFRRFQRYIHKHTALALCIFWGRGFFQYSFGLIPHRTPVTVVVGSPIELPTIAEPTTEQINEYHEKFIQQLVELFETQKYNYLKDPDKAVLELNV